MPGLSMYARLRIAFLRIRSRTRANALYRLLTQTVRSLRYKLTTPRLRFYCLLTQTGCSLMGLKKTNAAFAALVFSAPITL